MINKREAFRNGFPQYCTCLAIWIFAIISDTLFPSDTDLFYRVFSLFALVWLIPATAFTITGAMKKNA